MNQISYGTITVIDTTDIDEIYMIYAGSSSDTVSPTWTYAAVTDSSIWNRDISQISSSFDYIWQSTVVTKSGVIINSTNWTDFYGSPVCVTGPDGAAGKGISNITIEYCNYADGTPADSYSEWQNSPPSYDSTKPYYWTKTTITYTEGSPYVKKVLDQGLTDAMRTAYEANTLSNENNEAINGSPYFQYTTGGTTYDVWEEDGSYYYYNASGVKTEVSYEDLDKDINNNPIIVYKGGLSEQVNTLSKAVIIDQSEPSVSIQAGTSSEATQIKITNNRISFIKNGGEVAYLSSQESEGVIDINNARLHNTLRIGDLEIVTGEIESDGINLGRGLGIRKI